MSNTTLRAIGLGDAHRLALRGLGVGAREMRAGDDDGAAEAMKASSMSSSSSAMSAQSVAVEDQRRNAFVFSTASSTSAVSRFGSVTMPVGRHALARQLLADEAAHLLVADAG